MFCVNSFKTMLGRISTDKVIAILRMLEIDQLLNIDQLVKGNDTRASEKPEKVRNNSKPNIVSTEEFTKGKQCLDVSTENSTDFPQIVTTKQNASKEPELIQFYPQMVSTKQLLAMRRRLMDDE